MWSYLIIQPYSLNHSLITVLFSHVVSSDSNHVTPSIRPSVRPSSSVLSFTAHISPSVRAVGSAEVSAVIMEVTQLNINPFVIMRCGQQYGPCLCLCSRIEDLESPDKMLFSPMLQIGFWPQTHSSLLHRQ